MQGRRPARRETRELIPFIIDERLSLYFKQHRENGRRETQRSEEFLKLLQEKAPELTEEFEKYLDWVAEFRKEDQTGLYLFGIHDGIQLMRNMIIAS